MIRVLSAILVIALTFVPTAVADKSDWYDPYEVKYLNAYEDAHEEGFNVGRNLLDYSWKPNVEQPPKARVVESTDRLLRWLNPPPPPPQPVQTAPAQTEQISQPTQAQSSGGGWAIPEHIVMCESRGDYGAVNPSSGARGAYQIMPSTHSAYNCSGWSPAEQDACAAEIWADVGSSAWVC